MAGSSMKDIKLRIKSIQSTMQITKAMQLVASSKLRRAKERMELAAPYFDSFNQVIKNISCSSDTNGSVFFQKRNAEKICYCVIAGDRGLAGGYNNNVFKEVSEVCSKKNVQTTILPIGKKTVEFFKKRFNFVDEKYTVAANVSIGDCFEIGKTLTEKFLNGDFDELYLTYTSYKSVLKQEVVSTRIFPLESDFSAKKSQISYEPSGGAAIRQIMPSYVAAYVYNALAQSYVCELTSRQNAMDTATSNADEMLSSLQLQYNRARQAGITQEITEIVAGANS